MTEKSTIDLNGKATLGGHVFEPRVGVWYAEIEIDEEEAPSGNAILTIHGEVEFHGVISPKRTASDNGRVVLRLEGGSGNLDNNIGAQQFGKSTVKGLIDALFFQTGDALDESSPVLGHQVQHWVWGETVGEAAMHAIAFEANESTWRIQRNGTLYIGPETWPEIDPSFEYVEDSNLPGEVVIFPEQLPLVRPGTVFRGQRVAEVATSWGSGPLRQQVAFEDTDVPTRFTRSIQGETDWFSRTRGQELDLSKTYPCVVVGQSEDLLKVDLNPDDRRINGGGLKDVSLRLGVPGIRPRLKIGTARCLVGWEAADPKRPFAAIFERDGILEWTVQPDDGAPIRLNVTGANVHIVSDTRIHLDAPGVIVNGGGLEVARRTDLVAIALPTATAPGSPCAPALPGAPSQIGVILTGATGFESA